MKPARFALAGFFVEPTLKRYCSYRQWKLIFFINKFIFKLSISSKEVQARTLMMRFIKV